ncbi:cytochrome P450 [Crassisporium funariophilum]|nr:cytochrome P450 [Crassisporium funariophilum]
MRMFILESSCDGPLRSLCAILSLEMVSLEETHAPGPLGLPFMGNRHQLPPNKPWRKFAEWSKIYGPVTSFFLGSTPVIVKPFFGSPQPAWDLLEKRSEIYSSRPRFIVAGEILSDNKRGVMLPNNETCANGARCFMLGLITFNLRQSENYKDIQSLESKIVLKQIFDEPKDYERHPQRFAASVAVSVIYFRRINSVEEWVVKQNMDAMHYLTRTLSFSFDRVSVNIPGKYLVESWPWLLKLPRSLQWFRREPQQNRQCDINFLMHLLNDVKARLKNGTSQDCLTAQCITDMDQLGMSDLDLAYAVSSPSGAGIETTAGTMSSFVLAMLHYPEVQKKAQDELDAVVGHGRMPEYEDKENLPYVRALLNETMRWRPAPVLGGTPHASTADDAYNGMLTKGIDQLLEFRVCKLTKLNMRRSNPYRFTLMAKLMFMALCTKNGLPDPDILRPERFLETKHPRLQNFDLPFGFGRRSCPVEVRAYQRGVINLHLSGHVFDIRIFVYWLITIIRQTASSSFLAGYVPRYLPPVFYQFTDALSETVIVPQDIPLNTPGCGTSLK